MTARVDEFYVGYLAPAPRGVARRVRGAVLWLGVLVGGAAAAVAGFQGDAGGAVWELESVVMTGLFVAEPYPVLFVEGDGAKPRTVILVGAGKCGAFEPSGYCGLLGGSGTTANHDESRRAAMRLFDGKLVQVKGTRLRREGRAMVELAESERAVTVAPEDRELAQRLRRSVITGVHAMMTGTVVDSKCYLGAMKPGEGKAHRACAIRCIAGGIPPMLVQSDSNGSRFILLADSRGIPMGGAILPFVGDEIEVSGMLRWEGSDIWLLEVDASSVRRVDSARPTGLRLSPVHGR